MLIQAGSDFRRIKLNVLLVGYAYTFINYVVKEHNKGVDLYSVLKREMENIPPEQLDLCNAVRQEVQKIKEYDAKKIRRIKTAISIFMLSFVALFVALIIVAIILPSNDEGKDINSVNSTISTTVSSKLYSPKELINLPDHPRVFDKTKKVTEYYKKIGNNSIAVISLTEFIKKQAESR